MMYTCHRATLRTHSLESMGFPIGAWCAHALLVHACKAATDHGDSLLSPSPPHLDADTSFNDAHNTESSPRTSPHSVQHIGLGPVLPL